MMQATVCTGASNRKCVRAQQAISSCFQVCSAGPVVYKAGPMSVERFERRHHLCCPPANAVIADGQATSVEDSASSMPQAALNRQHISYPGPRCNNETFWDMVPHIRRALSRATFVAIDCEMTGLWAKGMPPGKLDNNSRRYDQIKDSVQAFLPVQFGISCFELVDNTYQVQSFNLDIYPADLQQGTQYSFQAMALEFLARNGFDLTAWVLNGVRYIPLSSRATRLAELDSILVGAASGAAGTESTQQPTATGAKAKASSSRKTESAFSPDYDFTLLGSLLSVLDQGTAGAAAAAAVMCPPSEDTLSGFQACCNGRSWPEIRRSVERWLDGDADSMELEVQNPDSAEYLQALIRLEMWCRPDLAPFTMTCQQQGPSQSWVVALTRTRVVPGQAIAKRGQVPRRTAIHASAGAAVLLDLIRASGAPLVVHNGLLDLGLVLHHFRGGPLPATWTQFKQELTRWFPGGIYDTRHMVTSLLPTSVQLSPGHTLAAALDTGLITFNKNTPAAPTSGAASSNTAATSADSSSTEDATHVTLPVQKMPLQVLFAQLCADLVQAPSSTDAHTGPQASSVRGAAVAARVGVYHVSGGEAYQQAAVDAIQQSLRTAATQSALQAGTGTGNESDSDSALLSAATDTDQPDIQFTSSEASLSHEAGFDAFMTGTLFAALLDRCKAHQAPSASSAGSVRSSKHDDKLAAVRDMKWKLAGRSGLAYHNLSGLDPAPQVPNLFLVTGLTPGTTWYKVQQRFMNAGFTPCRVFMSETHPGLWGGDKIQAAAAAASGDSQAAGPAPRQPSQADSQAQTSRSASNSSPSTARSGARKALASRGKTSASPTRTGHQGSSDTDSPLTKGSAALVEITVKHEVDAVSVAKAIDGAEKGWCIFSIRELYADGC